MFYNSFVIDFKINNLYLYLKYMLILYKMTGLWQ